MSFIRAAVSLLFQMLFNLLLWVGIAVQVLGGIAVLGLFLYGVYALFAKSILFGLLCIGGAVVGGFVVQLTHGLLLLLGAGSAAIYAVADDDRPE